MSERFERSGQEGLEHASLHRANMVYGLERSGHLTSGGLVEAAFRKIPRELCVPSSGYTHVNQQNRIVLPPDRTMLPADVLKSIYDRRSSLITKFDEMGRPLSSLSAPHLVADMLEALDVQPGHEVLEIGAGGGYNAALIATITDERVVTLEIDLQVATEAQQSIQRLGLAGKVNVLAIDGTEGHHHPEGWDRIIATVGLPGIPAKWLAQLAPGGVLVAPVMMSGTTPVLAIDTRNAWMTDGFLLARGVSWEGFVHAQGQLGLGDKTSQATASEELLITNLHTLHQFLPTLDDARYGGLNAYLSLSDPRIVPRAVRGFGPYSPSLWDPATGHLSVIQRNEIITNGGQQELDEHITQLLHQWHDKGEPSFADFGFALALDEENDRWVPVADHWHINAGQTIDKA